MVQSITPQVYPWATTEDIMYPKPSGKKLPPPFRVWKGGFIKSTSTLSMSHVLAAYHILAKLLGQNQEVSLFKTSCVADFLGFLHF